ncbi:MAG TPA: polysaccharide biosynthesis/export family protein [Bryobacteraceae bacterium]|jgi:polysaccharide export outer membrane protein|nr:polysaccharide biosynthesis/export family protein [Bryobacteraceae bacterium]
MTYKTFGGKFLNLAAVVLFSLAVAAAAQNSSQQNPPAEPANPDQTGPAQNAPPSGQAQPESKPAEPAQPTAGAPVDSNSYKVGPADVLYIRVWNEQQFTGPVTVQDNGHITLPLVGDLPAGDKTPNQIQEIVAKALTKFVVKPLVTVTVQAVESKKYYMDGLVARPGEYLLITPTTVFQAISKANGLQEFANGKKIYVLRGTQRIPFNYKEVIHGKNMAQNIQLQPGDHVVVP